MKNQFNIINENSYDLKEIDLRDFVNFILEKENIEKALFDIIFVDNKTIRKINKEYRNMDKETDVISFALEDFEDEKNPLIRVLGDIYISYEKAFEQADTYKHSIQREIAFLTVHGILHLLGYNHIDETEEKIMFERQELILNEYGIKREI